MCAPCADHKLRPVCEYAHQHHTLTRDTVRYHNAEVSTDTVKALEPDAKRPTWIPWPQQVKLPDNIA